MVSGNAFYEGIARETPQVVELVLPLSLRVTIIFAVVAHGMAGVSVAALGAEVDAPIFR